MSVRRHRSAMLPLGPSSDSTPDGGGGLRARWAAYLSRVKVWVYVWVRVWVGVRVRV